jgi:hypothetical protein
MSTSLSFVPIILSRFPLPEKMVLAENNSAVISAACHSIRTNSTGMKMPDSDLSKQKLLADHLSSPDEGALMSAQDARVHMLAEMSRQELKWGVVFKGQGMEARPGHLAFGTLDQNVEVPIEGMYCSGKKEI